MLGAGALLTIHGTPVDTRGCAQPTRPVAAPNSQKQMNPPRPPRPVGNIGLDFGSTTSKMRGMWNRLHADRVLEQAMRDVGAKAGWILDQADGTDTLRPGLVRRNFAATPEWLP